MGVSGSFYVACETVNVNMRKIVSTQSISEAQILQVKHITRRKTYSKSRYKSFYGGEEGSEQQCTNTDTDPS